MGLIWDADRTRVRLGGQHASLTGPDREAGEDVTHRTRSTLDATALCPSRKVCNLDGFPTLMHRVGLVTGRAVSLSGVAHGDPREVTERRIGV